MILASSGRNSMLRRIDRCGVLSERRVQIVVHRQSRHIRSDRPRTRSHLIPGSAVGILCREHNNIVLRSRLKTHIVFNLQNRIPRHICFRAALAINLRRTIGLNTKPRRCAALDLFITFCILTNTTLDRRVKIRCFVRFGRHIPYKHIHGCQVRVALQATLHRRICLRCFRRNRSEVRHVNVSHAIKRVISLLVDRKSR